MYQLKLFAEGREAGGDALPPNVEVAGCASFLGFFRSW